MQAAAAELVALKPDLLISRCIGHILGFEERADEDGISGLIWNNWFVDTTVSKLDFSSPNGLLAVPVLFM